MAKKSDINKQKEENFDWDPVKYAKDGKKAQAVIWSTNVINAAVDAIKKGLPLKANPFIGKNTLLLKPDLVFRKTEEEIEEAIKCMEDPVYFASKCQLMTPTGLKLVTLRDYQVDYLHHLQKNRFTIWLACRQAGKCLAFNQSGQFGSTKYLTNPTYFYDIFNKYYKKSYLWKIEYFLYKLGTKFKCLEFLSLFFISLLDVTFNNGNDKMIDEICVDDLYVNTDSGIHKVNKVFRTKPFEQYKIKLENGYEITGADNHIIYYYNYIQTYIKGVSVGEYIITDKGPSKVISIHKTNRKLCMFDIEVDSYDHRFWSNGVLSHNSVTTAIYCLWVILFHIDKTALILSKSGPAGQDLVKKIKDMYLHLPYYLKAGTLKWNQSEISFDNNSSISTEPFSPTAGLGKTINFLILDEFAWCPANEVELFYNNIVPTVTTITNSNVCIMSTQNGRNYFYTLWHAAETKQNVYAPFKVDWYQVPQYNPDTGQWEKRTEAWKEMMVGILGSEQAFYYQYGTQFLSSDKCLVSRETISRLRDNTYLFEKLEKITQMSYFSLKKEFLFFDPNFDLSKLKTEFFIILNDLAEGGGNDYTVFNILMVVGKDKFKQVGYWRSNIVDLELAALEFWVLYAQLFNPERCIVSIEWNTYGALFYNYITQYNEFDYKPEYNWRFIINRTGEFDITSICHYKKGSQEEEIAGVNGKKFKNLIPGIRFNSSNKKTACALLKMMIERNEIEIFDLVTISELENFEDTNGNGSYAAAMGHDDIIMTLCQLPMVKNTARYKSFMEEYENIHNIEKILKQSNELSPSTQNVVPQIPEGLEAYAYGNVNQYGINMNFTAMGVYTGEDIMNQAINGFVNPYGGYQGYY